MDPRRVGLQLPRPDLRNPDHHLPIVEKAIEELEWCLDRGARCILIRPAPAWGLRGPRSPGLPEFDPFWARVQEAGVLVGMHSSDSGYADLVSIWEGKTEFLPFKPNPGSCGYCCRPGPRPPTGPSDRAC
jgi:hypothetical protein